MQDFELDSKFLTGYSQLNFASKFCLCKNYDFPYFFENFVAPNMFHIVMGDFCFQYLKQNLVYYYMKWANTGQMR